MGDKTKIQWTEASWNPVTGCSHISPGCERCYAETLSRRYGWTQAHWGAQNAAQNVRLHSDRLHLPLRWKRARRIFVNSMSDVFHPHIPDEFRHQMFAIMALSHAYGLGHCFQILTKRAQEMVRYMTLPGLPTLWAEEARRAGVIDEGAMCHLLNSVEGSLGEGRNCGWPLKNVWLGCSVEDQRRADERIPLLLQTPTAVRWLSVEPLLGPITLRPWLPLPGSLADRLMSGWIDWVVIGGESGQGARRCDLDWIHSIIEECEQAQVPCFVKQLGTKPVGRQGNVGNVAIRLKDWKGGKMEEWPDKLRVRQYPSGIESASKILLEEVAK